MGSKTFYNLKYSPEAYDWLPRDLIFAGDGGFWYDFGDWTNMYLDRAMTTPVTAVGQSVAAVRDKGPNGFHLFQDTASRRPKSFIQGGFNCLDFDVAALQCMYTDIDQMKLTPMHGWVIAETDDATTHHRFISTSTTGNDTANSSSLAITSGDASQIFNVRGLTGNINASVNSTGNTPFGVYEYDLNASLCRVWKDNVVGAQDASAGGLIAKSNGITVIGAQSTNNAPSGAATGALNGRIWQILHLGTLPSAADETKVENWFAQWRY